MYNDLVQSDYAETFFEAANDNSAWKTILFKTTREIGFVSEIGVYIITLRKINNASALLRFLWGYLIKSIVHR